MTTKYTLPPSDRSLSLLQTFEFNAAQNPDHPMFRYDSTSAPEGYEDITWKRAVEMFDTTAQIIRSQLARCGVADCTSPPVVGILASTGAILYATLIFGTMRAGCAVFPLSTRNSDVAIAHLIAESGVKYLLVSQDAHMQETARKAQNLLQLREAHIHLLPIPTYEEISADVNIDLDALPPLGPVDDERVLVFAHSSGSTSFPKVIPMTQRYFRTFSGSVDLSTRVQSGHGIGMFHAWGFNSVIRAAYCGSISSNFPPTLNAVMATPERLLASALATKSAVLMCPPMFLEHWAQDPVSVEKLRTFSGVIFAGGPLAQSVGDSLAQRGVALIALYGATEIGAISHMHPDPSPGGWQYFQFLPTLGEVLIPVEGDATGLLFQLLVKECATNCLALTNTEIDGVRAYDTKDIVQRHPTDPTLYRVYGRIDDQIMHSNGEKTNPGPLEEILAQDPRIKMAIMFGRERPHAGVIIAPTDDVEESESLRDAIWPTVERANNFAPSHSRIFKEMIIVATPSRPFHLTPKGTPRRQAILADYAQDIDEAYTVFDRSAPSTGSQGQREATMAQALEIVQGHVRTNVGLTVSDDENIFDAGADRYTNQPALFSLTLIVMIISLLAARIRQGIIQALAGLVPETALRAIPNDIVFTFPTVMQLTAFVYGVSVAASAFPNASNDTDTPFKNVPASILDHKDSTIVPLRDPTAGEPPLILIHGGGGFIYSFVYLQTHMHTGLWAIQVTNETPKTSFVAQTDFYYRKIKEAQPTGPYRVGGYSAGGLMACRVAKLLEAGGDKVIQLVLIDSSPFLALAPRPGFAFEPEADLSDPQTLRAQQERGLWGLCTLLRGYNDPWWPKLADAMWERFHGRIRAEDMSELMAKMYEGLVEGSARAFDFIVSLAPGNQKIFKEVLRGLTQWMKALKAPVTLYKATRGALVGIAPEAEKEWWAVGLDWCCDLRVVEVEVDHIDMLCRGELVEDLETNVI
ncbi:hypothetical protein C8R47DRAFT_1151234 [Mycena vitilis]|nr:hypothetical protein C8R47DRAFT_1151234 [Mycena vitilis]